MIVRPDVDTAGAVSGENLPSCQQWAVFRMDLGQFKGQLLRTHLRRLLVNAHSSSSSSQVVLTILVVSETASSGH